MHIFSLKIFLLDQLASDCDIHKLIHKIRCPDGKLKMCRVYLEGKRVDFGGNLSEDECYQRALTFLNKLR